jgi:hypothetical protein
VEGNWSYQILPCPFAIEIQFASVVQARYLPGVGVFAFMSDLVQHRIVDLRSDPVCQIICAGGWPHCGAGAAVTATPDGALVVAGMVSAPETPEGWEYLFFQFRPGEDLVYPDVGFWSLLRTLGLLYFVASPIPQTGEIFESQDLLVDGLGRAHLAFLTSASGEFYEVSQYGTGDPTDWTLEPMPYPERMDSRYPALFQEPDGSLEAFFLQRLTGRIVHMRKECVERLEP